MHMMEYTKGEDWSFTITKRVLFPLNQCHAKCFQYFSHDHGPIDVKLLQVFQFMYGGLHKVLTLPASVLLAKKQFCNAPLTANGLVAIILMRFKINTL